MRRALPTRKVSIPYHGMTFPIPQTSSFFSPRNGSNRAEVTMESQVQHASSREVEICSSSHVVPAANSRSPSPPVAAQTSWTSTGRGRVLQNLMSQVSSGVGRRQSATPRSHTPSGPISPPPPPSPNTDPPLPSTQETQVVDTHTPDKSPRSDFACEEADSQPVDPGKLELANDSAVDIRAASLPLESLQSPPSSAPTPVVTPTKERTPRTLRKSRISLAIQFKGVCLPPQGHCNTTSQRNTISANLMKPGDFTASPAEVGSAEARVHCESKTSEGGAQCLKDKDMEAEKSSSEAVLTQVSDDMGDYDIVSEEPQSLHASLKAEGEGEKEMMTERVGLSGEASSEGEELEGTRMGLSAAQLEKSISLHQRTTHRNRVEVKRLQRRVQRSEEVLAADLAEQCSQEDQDTLNYCVTPDRESEVTRLLDLQLQFDSQSLDTNRNSFTDDLLQLESCEATVKCNKLMQMELKLEAAALEEERQLQLVKKEALLLQTKSETIV